MAQYEHLPIYKRAFDMAIYIDNMVRGFSRYNKYSIGGEMRDLSRMVIRLIIRANSETDKIATLTTLRDTVEELRVVFRVGKEIKAFKSFDTFKHLIEDTISLSRQCEGWMKSVRGKQ
ncbi:four helix bundle protein [Candidatus Magnetobacterium casense]|uniref:Four helix bundle protein n=1 Tax=Candidatus Magnetobacterium casense TaxID=1455061 RepID=A0ABS6S0F6_9BACT|nr:four helix bundle protein [Candidatus Magnetobacterium casensis]MBV6341874.1 four helix bundle protein [Candidatus Magnetobacterium casensis]